MKHARLEHRERERERVCKPETRERRGSKYRACRHRTSTFAGADREREIERELEIKMARNMYVSKLGGFYFTPKLRETDHPPVVFPFVEL